MSVIYQKRGSPIVFASTGQTVLFTPKNIANNAGRVSSQRQRTANPGEAFYIGRMKTKLQLAAVAGTILTCYLVTGDGTDIDGGVGATDAALAAGDVRRSFTPIGVLVANAATVGPFYAPIGLFEVNDEYFQIAWFNELGQALTNVDADHYTKIWPVNPEVI